MDTSTYIFIATLAVAFVFLRWLISPIPESNEFNLESTRVTEEGTASGASTSGTDSGPRTAASRNRRPVTDSMIEVVQTIAPSLTRDQIMLDLNRTGSVELTVEAYMENGNLPYPPNSGPADTPSETPTANAQSSAPSNGSKKANLLEKYDIDVTKLDDPVEESDNSLHRKKQEMIIGARKRLAAQLNNELDL